MCCFWTRILANKVVPVYPVGGLVFAYVRAISISFRIRYKYFFSIFVEEKKEKIIYLFLFNDMLLLTKGAKAEKVCNFIIFIFIALCNIDFFFLKHDCQICF